MNGVLNYILFCFLIFFGGKLYNFLNMNKVKINKKKHKYKGIC